MLAENIMKKVFIPDVRGIEINKAQSRVSQKGLNVTRSELGPSPLDGKAGKVETITPEITKRVKKGTTITLSYYEERPDRASQLADMDCSQWPGSEELIDLKTGKSECGCFNGKVWNADHDACIDKNIALPSYEEIKKAGQDFQLAQKDCSQFPGTEPVWDTQKDQAVCACKQGLVLNANKNGCITQQQAAFEKKDCSQFPGTIVVWNNQLNEPSCECPRGYVWVPKFNQCVAQKDLAAANLDCSAFRNTEPVWDPVQQKEVCGCIPGTVLNKNGNGCIDQREAALENTDCSRFPGTFPAWDYQNNQPVCSCLSGSHWDNISGRCVSDTVNENQMNCSEWPNTLPGWNPQTQRFECMCMSPNVIDQRTGECISWVTALTQSQNPPNNNGANPPPPTTIKQGRCNETKRAGANEPEHHVINMGRFAGQFLFEYKTFTEEDMIKVSQADGRVLFQTGCVGSGNGWTPVMINFSGYSPEIIVDVNPNCDGGTTTQWEFKVSCPK